MDSTYFMGMLIIALVTLATFAGVIATLIVKPIINLNKSITKLNASIDQLNGDNARLEARVSKHGERLDAHDQHLVRVDCEIDNLKDKEKKK